MPTRGSKLTSKKRKELILGLCRAICVLKNPQEVAEALTDLLTPKEIETVAKRLEIAQYLIDGKDYDYVRSELKVGYSTIARVNTWLNLSGDGFKIMFSRRKKSPEEPGLEEKYDPYSWFNIKRRYSLYFWPQLLLGEILKESDRKEKEKIQKIFEKLQAKKHRFSKEENKALFELFSSEGQRVKRE